MFGTLRWRTTTPVEAPETDARADAASSDYTDAFAALYETYADPIYRYCYRRLGDPIAAEDATSQIFLKAMTAFPRLRSGSTRAWLFTIAANTVVDTYRARHPVNPIPSTFDATDPTPGPEALSEADEQRRIVRNALAALPTTHRQVVELRLAGLTSTEIAAVLNQTLPAVKSLQTRAYARLRMILVAPGAEEEHPDVH